MMNCFMEREYVKRELDHALMQSLVQLVGEHFWVLITTVAAAPLQGQATLPSPPLSPPGIQAAAEALNPTTTPAEEQHDGQPAHPPAPAPEIPLMWNPPEHAGGETMSPSQSL